MNHIQGWDYDIKLFIINNHNSTTSPILSKVPTLTATGSVSKYGNQVEFEKLNLFVFSIY